MIDLPDSIFEKVEALSEEGNVLLEDDDNWRGAVRVWESALGLLPEPKTQWEAALWLYASLGEAQRTGKDLSAAKDMLYSALNCPDGHMNPLVLLRLGQTLADLGDVKEGVEYLLRAYMLEGEEIFADDGAPYLKLLREKKLVD